MGATTPTPPRSAAAVPPSSALSWPLLAVGLFAAYLLTMLLLILVDNRPLLQWWNENDPQGRYRRCLNIPNFLTQTQGNGALNWLQKLFLADEEALSSAQTRFLSGILFPYQRYTYEGKQYGVLTPRHLCESILFTEGDGDEAFAAWLASTDPPRRSSVELTIKGNPDGTDAELTQDPDGNWGVYPGVDDRNSWRLLISYWLNGKGGPYVWTWAQDDRDFWQLRSDPARLPPGKGLLDEWFSPKHGSNFLARYAVLPTSPLVVYFVNDKYSYEGLEVDAQAFKNLVGARGGIAGGWIGLMKGMPSDVGMDHFCNFLFTSVDAARQPPPKPPCPATTRVASAAKAGVVGAVPTLTMLAFGLSGAAVPLVVAAAALMGGLASWDNYAGTAAC